MSLTCTYALLCMVVHMLCLSSEFGAKVLNLKTLMKALPALFEHSDKNVRAEVSELYCLHVYVYLRAGYMLNCPFCRPRLLPLSCIDGLVLGLDPLWRRISNQFRYTCAYTLLTTENELHVYVCTL